MGKNVVYDRDSNMGKIFAGLDSVVDMKQAVMKSSNIVGNVVADKFVDGHLHKFTHCSNENVHLYKQAYDEVCVVADNMFVDDHFQKLSKISDETGNVHNNSCKFVG
ncbi:hypothetical protein HanPI659440_Chr01g0008101 [Helianthus annuus]|nr:hypothetical protein HanPI659440_Chr01g0008101 [Helianthus annuus]